MTMQPQPAPSELADTPPARSIPDQTSRRYPVVFHNGSGIHLPSWLNVPAALQANPQTYFLVESSVTQAEFHDITGRDDLIPYLGQYLNHDEGDGVFNLEAALEQLEVIAEIANCHQRPGPDAVWVPRDRSEFNNDLERAADLLAILIPCLDCEWKIYDQTDQLIANVTQQSPAGFARYLTVAPDRSGAEIDAAK